MITIVIAPIGISETKFSDISFLGSILDKGLPRREFRNLRSYSQLGHHSPERLFTVEEGVLSREPSKGESAKDHFSKSRQQRAPIGELLDVDKRVPEIAGEELKTEATSRFSEIKGEVRDRAILYKPPMPEYENFLPDSLKAVSTRYLKVRLKVIIMPDGGVESVEKLQTSGYSEIDLMAIRHVKKWKFAPLNPASPQSTQEEIILLEFE